MQWAIQGDQNTRFFHSFMKARRNTNRIFSIRDINGKNITEVERIAKTFTDFYTTILGTSRGGRDHVCSKLVKRGSVVTEESRKILEATYSEKEVKHALRAIARDKSPGSDGYGSQFFKDSWRITGKDLTAGVLEFFKTRKLLHVLNNRVISKMLCLRLWKMLLEIISANQSAFVEGRSIAQNILICEDLVRLYNKKNTTKSFLIKIDLKKAYDSVEWEFVEDMLYVLNFPCKFIRWIMTCITTTQYTIAINGGIYGNITGKKGLRQGGIVAIAGKKGLWRTGLGEGEYAME
nr:uncharacterized protein LOC104119081 [Nicotiana tomentosiformis]